MKIIKYTKLKNNQYKILLDNDLEIKLYDEIILKENLLINKEISTEKLNELISLNEYYLIYYKSLKLINTKLRTEKELFKILSKYSDSDTIKKCLDKLKKEGYLNDEVYINSYIHDQILLSLKGPYKIKRELLNLNLDENIIDKYLSNYDNQFYLERIDKYINKRIKVLKNKSNQKILTKLKEELFNLGYQEELIIKSLNNINLPNDLHRLKKDCEILKNKLAKKYSNDKLNYYLINKLLQKGYSYDDIKNII